MYVFSAKTLSFYPVELKEAYVAAGSWQSDAVEVDEQTFTKFTSQPPEGKQRGADEQGQPAWIDIPVTTEDIAAAKQHKKQLIEEWRNEQENSHFVLRFTDKNWDYSKETQERLTLAVDMAKKNKLPQGFFWTDADNNDVPVTSEQLIALNDTINAAMFTKGLKIHIRQREMKTEVDALTTVNDIYSYKIDWKDE